MKRPETVIIPAAGSGSRMGPITRFHSKEMLALGRKPLIQRTLEECEESDCINRCIVITNDNKHDLNRFIKYYSASTRLEVVRIVQEEPLGLAHAVNLSRKFTEDSPFFVALPDNVVFYNADLFKALSEVCYQTSCNVAALMWIKSASQAQGFGNCGRGTFIKTGDFCYTIDRLDRKGEGTLTWEGEPFIRTFGRYLYLPEFFTCFDSMNTGSTGLIELDDVPIIQMMIEDKQMMGYLADSATVYDTGNERGYLMANSALLSSEYSNR